jgi:cytochrome c oxidase subunit II
MHVDIFYFFLIAVSVFFMVFITAMLLLFVIRYRRSKNPVSADIHGSLALEITWTVIPLAISMVIFAWGAILFYDLNRPPAGAMEIFGTGKQWMWKFQHESGQREINELHVPVGRDVKVTLTSQDVIHSFYVPAFRVKNDVIPGRYTTVWFNATKPGTFHLFCAEYCGTKHSGMIGRVVVMETDEFQAWLAGGSEGSMAQTGQKLFEDLACITCHSGESGARGPELAGVYGTKAKLADGREVTVDDAYIRESIMTPQSKIVAGYQPIMPTFQGQVSEESVLQLIAYIKSLQKQQAPGAAAPAAAVTTGTAPQVK